MENITSKPYDKIKINKKDGVATIEGEITLEAIEDQKNEELRKLKKDFKLPGFRPGNVPDEKVLEHIDKVELFEESARNTLSEAYPEILRDHDIHPITYPRVEVKKIVMTEPLEFKIEVGTISDFKLPNYISIAKSEKTKEPEEIKDEEIEKIIKDIEKARSTDEKPFLITDETVKIVGKFESVLEFRTKLKEHIVEEKKEMAKNERRENIGKQLIEKTKFELPKFWMEDEGVNIINELDEYAKQGKTTKEEILKRLKKTEEEFIREELKLREKGEKIKIILEKIAKEEKIELKEDEIEREAMNIKAYYQTHDHDHAKKLAKSALARQKALEFLENLA